MRHLSLAIALLVGTALSAQNAFLNNSFFPRYWKANTDFLIAARVRNSNATPLISFHVDWRWNNGPVQIGNWQSTTGITGNQYWPYEHQIPFNQPASAGVLKVWVVGSGDTDPSNDTLRFTVDVIGNWVAKSVLIEQYTGTWCQFCPAANAATNGLDVDPLIVVAKHHNMDEFTNQNSTDYWAWFNANYSPAGVMEQEEFGTLPDDAAYDQWGARAEQRKLGVSPASISVSAAFNEWTRLLTVDVNTTMTAVVNGTFIVNAYILEDNLPGPQTNAPAGYIHHQVVREVLGGPDGTAGVIPATTVANGSYDHQYTFTVPEQWNHNNLRVIAMVTEVRTGTLWTVNVAEAEVVAVGVEESASAEPIGLYPNPSDGPLWIHIPANVPSHIRVFSSDGRCVIDHTFPANGGTIRLDAFADLPAGTYLVRVEAGKSIRSERVVRIPTVR